MIKDNVEEKQNKTKPKSNNLQEDEYTNLYQNISKWNSIICKIISWLYPSKAGSTFESQSL